MKLDRKLLFKFALNKIQSSASSTFELKKAISKINLTCFAALVLYKIAEQTFFWSLSNRFLSFSFVILNTNSREERNETISSNRSRIYIRSNPAEEKYARGVEAIRGGRIAGQLVGIANYTENGIFAPRILYRAQYAIALFVNRRTIPPVVRPLFLDIL